MRLDTPPAHAPAAHAAQTLVGLVLFDRALSSFVEAIGLVFFQRRHIP